MCSKDVKLRNMLKLRHRIPVDNIGISGGLALLWDLKINVFLNSFSKRHIDVTIKMEEKDRTWHFTGFYGNPIIEKCYDSWTLLRKLSHGRTSHWMCVGDFNKLLFPNEKKGKNEKGQRQI